MGLAQLVQEHVSKLAVYHLTTSRAGSALLRLSYTQAAQAMADSADTWLMLRLPPALESSNSSSSGGGKSESSTAASRCSRKLGYAKSEKPIGISKGMLLSSGGGGGGGGGGGSGGTGKGIVRITGDMDVASLEDNENDDVDDDGFDAVRIQRRKLKSLRMKSESGMKPQQQGVGRSADRNSHKDDADECDGNGDDDDYDEASSFTLSRDDYELLLQVWESVAKSLVGVANVAVIMDTKSQYKMEKLSPGSMLRFRHRPVLTVHRGVRNTIKKCDKAGDGSRDDTDSTNENAEIDKLYRSVLHILKPDMLEDDQDDDGDRWGEQDSDRFSIDAQGVDCSAIKLDRDWASDPTDGSSGKGDSGRGRLDVVSLEPWSCSRSS